MTKIIIEKKSFSVKLIQYKLNPIFVNINPKELFVEIILQKGNEGKEFLKENTYKTIYHHGKKESI